MKNQLVLMLFLMMLSSHSSGIIIRQDQLASLCDHIQWPEIYTTLIAFDIDHTIILPKKRVPHAFFYSCNDHEFDQKSPLICIPQSDYPPVEATTPILISFLRTLPLQLVALTKRSFKKHTATVAQLRTLNIDFSNFFHGDLQGNYGHYHQGIIFTGNKNKGSALQEILQKTSHKPTSIIFCDNCFENVVEVLNCCELMGCSYTGIVYERVNHYKKSLYNQHICHDLLLETHNRIDALYKLMPGVS